jgi:hypothetical protein
LIDTYAVPSFDIDASRNRLNAQPSMSQTCIHG